MSDVIQFPTKIIRSRSLIEKSIREILDQTQADEDSKNEIIKRSLDIWDKYQCNFSFPVVLPENLSEKEKSLLIESINKGLTAFQSCLHDHMNVIFLERIQTEIKLYFLEAGVRLKSKI